jgi:RNA polymerase sigma-70 factor (ECF subfamily)
VDLDLLRRASAGDSAAFAALFERYQHVVYRFARAMTGSADAADDVTQEVFIILIRDLHRFQPERSALSTYLYGIARNVSRDRARRERRFVPLDVLGLTRRCDPDVRGPFDRLLAAEADGEVRAALARLPVQYREVVVLCDLHDLSYAEVAAIVRASVGAVRSRLHRGRVLLRQRLSRAERPAEHAARSVGWST